MATDKPLPDSDDDIIDLTDLVEEGSAAGGAAGDDGVDMSFEQELDDLFGDAEPMPAKSAPAAKAPPAATAEEDDLFDLAGFEVADDEDADATSKPVAADADDDVMDLSSLGLDEAEDAHADDSLPDLGFDDVQPAAPAAAKADDDLDISDLSFDDLVPDDAPKAKAAADNLDDLDFGDLEEKPAAVAAAAPVPEPMDLDALDFDAPEQPSPDAAADIAAMLTTEDDSAAQAVSDADLDALLAEPDQAAGDAAMAELLGELPDVPEAAAPEPADAADLADAPDMAALAAPADEAPLTSPSAAAAAVVMAAAAVPLAAMAASGAARSDSGPSVGGIDLGALDTLIDSSKAPSAAPEATAAPNTALLARLDALEAAAADLGQRLDAVAESPDEEALAQAVSARLEDALAARFEALIASQPAAPDLDGLKAGLLDELHVALAEHREALRSEFPVADDRVGDDELTNALTGMRESLTRLEALSQGRHIQFEDFAQSMESKIAELRQELPAPKDFVSPQNLAEALDGLRQTLADDLTASLDARLDVAAEAARQETREAVQPLVSRLDALEADRVDPEALAQILRQSLADDLAVGLNDRLKAVADAARDEVESLREPLAGRLDALEKGRIDPEALTQKLRQSLADELALDLDARLNTAAEDAREAVASLGEALTGRLDALEKGRIDPDALAANLRQTLLSDALDPQALQDAADTAAKADAAAQKALAGLDARLTTGDFDDALKTLRADMTAEMERAVPQAAAAVIREEIAALLKDFSE